MTTPGWLTKLAALSHKILAALVGAGIAAFRPLGPKSRSAIQHFTAGVVFTAVALELLPI